MELGVNIIRVITVTLAVKSKNVLKEQYSLIITSTLILFYRIYRRFFQDFSVLK